MRRGDRVSTPRGTGCVNYTRTGPPNYNAEEPVAVSVFLDTRLTDKDYAGTVFHVSDVRPLPEPEPVLSFYGAPVLDCGEHFILFACGCCWWGFYFGEHALCVRHGHEWRRAHA